MARRVTCLTLAFSSIATASLQFPHGLTDDGFDSDVSFVPSSGGNASCITGLISLTTTSTYMNINFPNPESPEAITDAFLNLVGNNYTIYTSSSGTSEQTKNFNIWSKLCVPVDSTVQWLDTIHFLTHGGTVDHSYWDLSKGYSYVDAAANAGYATFSYDRLGIGHSSRPDPINDVQAPVQVDLAHLLIQKLREGAIGGAGPFKHVVGVGHSAGSTFTEAISAKYTHDYDAVIVTGTSADPGSYAMSVMVSWDPVQASDAPKGYFTQATRQAVQFPFFKWPYFEPWSKYFLYSPTVPASSSVSFELNASQFWTSRINPAKRLRWAS